MAASWFHDMAPKVSQTLSSINTATLPGQCGPCSIGAQVSVRDRNLIWIARNSDLD